MGKKRIIKTKRILKIRVDGYDDRTTLASILAENGHKVWIERNKEFLTDEEAHYVCIEILTPPTPSNEK